MLAPEFDGVVLTAGDEKRQLGVYHEKDDIVSVAEESLHRLFRLVVPHLDHPVVSSRKDVRLVSPEVLHTVDSLFMASQSDLTLDKVDVPDLDSHVQGTGGQHLGVLRVDADLHDEVGVFLQSLLQFESVLLHSPDLDSRVIRGSEHSLPIYSDVPDVIVMGLELAHFLEGVLIEESEHEVVTADHDPLLALDEAHCPDRLGTDLHALQQLL